MARFTLAASLALSAAIFVSFAPPAAVATEKVLYSFLHPCCGYSYARLDFMNGNLFGTGAGDAVSGHYGQVFELTNSGGSWTNTSIVLFNGSDGSQPVGGLIHDSSGNLYGTTSAGDTYGYGNAFYTFNSGGTWYFQKIWAFGGTGDGATPAGDLIMDRAGNLYGTTNSGGAHGYGIAFELSGSGSAWTETILHSFGSGSDGRGPYGGLVMDSAGNLYGTTVNGGAHGYGIAFELTQSGGVWSETVLHSFGSSKDGRNPYASLIIHSTGVLYGTTAYGGPYTCSSSYHCGTVFKVYLSSGVWKEKVLYNFTGGSDGAYPVAKLTMKGSGTLYGTASTGSVGGSVYKLTYSGGKWHETTLHDFNTRPDGLAPYGAVILDSSGNLYGTTVEGGTGGSCSYGCGTVWEVTP